MKNIKTPFFLSVVLATLLLGMGAVTAQPGAQIRTGDMLELNISGVPASEQSSISRVYTVADDGTLNLAYIGRVTVAGMSSNEAEKRIESAFTAAGIFTKPAVTINMAGGRFVNVEGAVRSPQRVAYTPDLTLLSAIAACGGFNEFAKQTDVTVSRGDKVERFNARELRRFPDRDPRLQPGDKIFVNQSWWP